MERAFLRCESHPGRPLEDHLRDVASRLRLSAPGCTWLSWCGLFHDLGKATSYFQAYLHGEEAPRTLRRHANLGAVWLLEHLAPKVANGHLGIVEAALAFLFVRRHHGRLDDLADALSDLEEVEIQEVRTQLASMDCAGTTEWLAAELGESVHAPATHSSRTGTRVQLLLELQKGCATSHSSMERFQAALRSFGQLIEADRDSAAGYELDAFDLPPVFTTAHANRLRDFLARAAAADPRIMAARDLVYRAAISGASDRPADRGALWSLTVPTGAGKTLAAIGWALKRREFRMEAGGPKSPIIYALPFTSIIDQNAAVFRQLSLSEVDASALSVHHHLAELGCSASREEESLARSWVEGWRSDIVCTTFVQVANALFHGTCSDSRRFSKLAGSILILDEVQAIPAYLWPVFRTALQCVCDSFGTDVLLVTATQPALFGSSERREIGPAPFPAEIADAFDRYDLYVEVGGEVSLRSVAEKLAREVARGGAHSSLVIMNTVQESLDLHELIRRHPDLHRYRLFHLSTNLRPKDRKRILEEIASCVEPHILVATQVVEAGVDITFDVVLRAIAPLDAIVQAAGRCNRHGTERRGRVVVLAPAGNTARAIYGDVHILLAQQVLEKVEREDDQTLVREPELVKLVKTYFTELDARIQGDTAARIEEAIHGLQFAALRGEGQDKDRHMKRVQLIDDSRDRTPHFIEIDEADVRVWQTFRSARAIAEPRVRRQRLRSLRGEIGQRIVEVPSRFQFQAPESDGAIVHVPLAAAEQWYDVDTGWKRG